MVTPSQHYGLVEAGSLFSCHRSPAHNRDIIKVIAVNAKTLEQSWSELIHAPQRLEPLLISLDSVQVY